MTRRLIALLACTALVMTRRAGATEETARYWYDSAGRLVAVGYTATTSTNAAAIRYAYDANGNRTNLTVNGLGDGTNTDGDDLPDGLEVTYFGHLGQTGAGDADGDRLRNADELAAGSDPALRNTDGDPADDYHEWMADTGPADPNAYFGIVAVSNAPAGLKVVFRSSARRTYTLKCLADLTAGAWTNVPGQGPRPGVDGLDSMTDAHPAARGGFYRLNVEKP